MESLLTRHALPAGGKCVIDIGSLDVNGTYRLLVERLGFHQYWGVDLSPGTNVDFVVPEGSMWTEVPESDVVISGQCLEHVRKPWQWINQVMNVIRQGGLLIVIAPWSWDIHRFPIDCWRILPDGMEALFDEVHLNTIEVGVDQNDCFGVARKSTGDSPKLLA